MTTHNPHHDRHLHRGCGGRVRPAVGDWPARCDADGEIVDEADILPPRTADWMEHDDNAEDEMLAEATMDAAMSGFDDYDASALAFQKVASTSL